MLSLVKLRLVVHLFGDFYKHNGKLCTWLFAELQWDSGDLISLRLWKSQASWCNFCLPLPFCASLWAIFHPQQMLGCCNRNSLKASDLREKLEHLRCMGTGWSRINLALGQKFVTEARSSDWLERGEVHEVKVTSSAKGGWGLCDRGFAWPLPQTRGSCHVLTPQLLGVLSAHASKKGSWSEQLSRRSLEI